MKTNKNLEELSKLKSLRDYVSNLYTNGFLSLNNFEEITNVILKEGNKILISINDDDEPSYNDLEKQRLQEQVNKMDDGYGGSMIKHFRDWD